MQMQLKKEGTKRKNLENLVKKKIQEENNNKIGKKYCRESAQTTHFFFLVLYTIMESRTRARHIQQVDSFIPRSPFLRLLSRYFIFFYYI